MIPKSTGLKIGVVPGGRKTRSMLLGMIRSFPLWDEQLSSTNTIFLFRECDILFGYDWEIDEVTQAFLL